MPGERTELAYRVTFIPGDGTGPEISEAVRRVLEATGVEFEWDWQDAGADVYEAEGTPLPDRVLESIRERGLAIKGPITTPVGSGFRSINVALRKELDLYACLRPCKAYEGVRTRFPEYDVLVLPNLYGDIVSDLCAGQIGGLGLAPGANIGDDYAVFEATHGSAPKYKGQNKVNPTALMLSGVMMLRHLDELEAADRMEAAIAEVIRKGEKVTYDLKPSRDDPTAVGTSQFADAVIEEMNA